MDTKAQDRSKWAWLPAAMPGVARLMAARRRSDGNAHVNECWHRGVVRGEPGWFFAREGALSVGTPWGDWLDVAAWQLSPTQATLVLRNPGEGTDAAH